MVCVYTSANVLQVYLIRSVLVHEGIGSHIRNEQSYDSSLWPTPHAWPELWVAEADAARVKQLLDDAEATEDAQGRLSIAWKGGELSLSTDTNATGGPDACPACEAEWEPGFEVCWSCEVPLP